MKQKKIEMHKIGLVGQAPSPRGDPRKPLAGFPARVPTGFNEALISEPLTNAVRSVLESNGRMSYGV